MNPKTKSLFFAAAVTAVLSLSSFRGALLAQPSPTEYELIELDEGLPSYYYNATPTDVNDQDQVTGYISIVGFEQAFRYQNGVLSLLGTTGGGTSHGFGLNSNGLVVGRSRYTTDHYGEHAFLYDGVAMSDLGVPTSACIGPLESAAFGINDGGVVTGWAQYCEPGDFGPGQRAFVLSNGTWTNLQTLPWYSGELQLENCGAQSFGFAINDSGHVTGWSGAYYRDESSWHCGGVHAFFYDGATMHSLGTLGHPALTSHGTGINASDQITGYSETDSGQIEAFVADPTNGMTSLGTLGGLRSQGWDINDSGHVTGWALNAAGQQEAFLYDGQSMVSLCSLTDCPGQGWSKLVVGNAINNNGSIVGEGYRDGDTLNRHAFLLRVKPGDVEGPVTSDVVLDPVLVMVSDTALLTATIDDSETGNSNVSSGEFSVDGTEWQPMVGSWNAPIVQASAVVTAPSTASVSEVCVRGSDEYANTGEAACALFVTYDPAGGYVTGGGWFYSSAGSYPADALLEGKARFGFVSRYKRGSPTPDGNAEFHFSAGNVDFRSSAYDWLVIAGGGSTARFKGTGTVNGELDVNGNPYGFMIWAGDGEPDTFRIRIWSELDGEETDVYDNGFAQGLGGGSIIIHVDG